MDLRKMLWLEKITFKQISVMCVLLVGMYFVFSPPTRLDDSIDIDLTVSVGSMDDSYLEEDNEPVTYSVYLMHNSGYLVKTEVEADNERSDVETVFELLRVGAPNTHPNTDGLIPAGAVIRDYQLEGDVLTLNLSESFLYYRNSVEDDLLSSLVWSMTELPGIDRVNVKIEGETIRNLNGKTDVGRGLTRAMGINVEVAAPMTVNHQMMLLYFFTDDSDGLLVPVTRLISQGVDPFEYAVSSLVQGPLGASYISVFNHRATLLEQPKLEDGIMTLNFCSGLFFNEDQTQVSSQVIKQLVMTMTEFDAVHEVSVVVEGSSRVFDDSGNPITVPVGRNVVLERMNQSRGFIMEY